MPKITTICSTESYYKYTRLIYGENYITTNNTYLLNYIKIEKPINEDNVECWFIDYADFVKFICNTYAAELDGDFNNDLDEIEQRDYIVALYNHLDEFIENIEAHVEIKDHIILKSNSFLNKMKSKKLTRCHSSSTDDCHISSRGDSCHFSSRGDSCHV